MKLNKGISIVAVLILLILLSNSKLTSAVIKISITEEVAISSRWITLGDIAVIEGISGEKLDKLRSINLGKAVFPGYSREIPRQQIELMLRNKDLGGADFHLAIPDRVVVRTSSRQLDREQLLNQAKGYLIGLIDYPAERIVIRPRFTPPEIILPDREYSLRFEMPDGVKESSTVSLHALIIVDGLVYQRVFLGFEIMIKHQVYVAKRLINSGEKVDQADFFQDERGLADFRGEIISDFGNPLVRDGVVRLPIPKDAVLTSYYLSLPDIVLAGDQIQAEVVFGQVKIITMVRARQSGKKGQYITVENVKTGHRFKARVISSHLVRLDK